MLDAKTRIKTLRSVRRQASGVRRQASGVQSIQRFRQGWRDGFGGWWWPAAQGLEAVDHGTEQLGGAGGVIQRGVGFALAEADTSGFAGFGQHRLPVHQSGQCGGIETGEG